MTEKNERFVKVRLDHLVALARIAQRSRAKMDGAEHAAVAAAREAIADAIVEGAPKAKPKKEVKT